MIDIKLSEERIQSILEPEILVPAFNIPKYKLRVFPGTLEELGKPINCNHIHVKFLYISFDEYEDLSLTRKCITQVNEVYFGVYVQNNNLRKHTDVYQIANAVIRSLRGCKLLVNETGDEIQGQSPAQVTKYEFTDVKNGGACYQSEINVMCKFTDIYRTKSA